MALAQRVCAKISILNYYQEAIIAPIAKTDTKEETISNNHNL
jgi:hypothetical protein